MSRALSFLAVAALTVGLTSAITSPASAVPTMYTLTYTAGANGSISGPSPQLVQQGHNGDSVTAVPAAHYHFVQWNDASTANPRTDTNVNSNIAVIASFAIDTFTLTYSAGSNGSISGVSPQTVNYGESGTVVMAVPATGYHFIQWSDASTANPRRDTSVTANVNVSASFGIDTHTLTYTAGVHGNITGSLVQIVSYGDSGTAVTAVPLTGYHFISWSDASTVNPRLDTNVIADHTYVANFAIDTHTLTYTAGANGSITGSASQIVNYGDSGTAVTAVPNAHYHFVNWNDASTMNPRLDSNVIADHAFVANFAIDTRTLTYIAGAHGSISGPETQTVNYGDTGTAVTALPSANYHFVNWSDGVLTATRRDTNVTTNLTVTANFAIDTRTLTYLAGANGTISGVTPQTVNYGESGTAVTAVPNANYHFVNWSDGVLTATRRDTTVTANLTATANFAYNDSHTVTYSADPHGSIVGVTPQVIAWDGTGTPVTAGGDTLTGYVFWTWSDDVRSATRTETHVTSDLNLIAEFWKADNVFTVTYLTDGHGSIQGAATQTVPNNHDGGMVTAIPAAGYSFLRWSDGVTFASRTELHVTANITVTALFKAETFTLTYLAGANGTISGTTPQVVTAGASGAAVTAVANSGYHFVNWSDGVLSATRTDVNVMASLLVTANFAINVVVVPSTPSYTLTYLAGANGTITGATTQVVTQGANGSAVTATPNAGYHFTSWSDGVLTATRTDTNVVANKTVTASFAVNPAPVAQAALTLSASPASVTVGGTSILTTQGGSGTGATSFATSTPSICSVSQTGVVTALAVGTCLVTATKAADSTYLQAVSPAASVTVTAPVVVPTTTRKSISASAYFKAYSAILTASGLKSLANLARNAKRLIANGYVSTKLVVKGYVQPTRATGNDRSLSTARAKAVALQLRKLGVRASVTVFGMGRAAQSSAAGRRADAVITLTLTR